MLFQLTFKCPLKSAFVCHTSMWCSTYAAIDIVNYLLLTICFVRASMKRSDSVNLSSFLTSKVSSWHCWTILIRASSTRLKLGDFTPSLAVLYPTWNSSTSISSTIWVITSSRQQWISFSFSGASSAAHMSLWRPLPRQGLSTKLAQDRISKCSSWIIFFSFSLDLLFSSLSNAFVHASNLSA